MPFAHALRTVDDLRDHYREPSRSSVAKQIDHLDAHCATFIGRSPLVVLATSSADGSCDVSPKGGRPGFVRVLDPLRLALGDLSGNNRLDSMRNVVERPGVALLFVIPGLGETLRVNGTATITTDPEVLDACQDGDVRPRVAIGVDVGAAYLHCGKALRRSGAWNARTWPDRADLPSAACILRDHAALPGVDAAAVQARLDEAYASELWAVGGEART